ncbi:hypothetical protein [Catellatospora coxensis]|uniref:Uncharacterized protein n=1 Tax=Catellatospora coxensis TaxID=310354 RepID=A0A8J3P620_9ACTN|nr:hypothetical protein [Catellatospora coxensis]GIG05328.1 hypothetical protein Cco03nite_20280 [Catellatospora coxensis]
MRQAAVWKIGIGSVLVAASWLQVVVPGWVFAPPQQGIFGLPVLPVVVLGLSSALFAVGAILAGEGICGAFGGTSLWDLVVRDSLMALRLLACGVAAGLVLEIVAQWSGRLWYYPWWTTWFYLLVLLPGFALYWVFIVESYLAVKAVLDAVLRRRPAPRPVRPWPVGAVALAVFAALSISWYARRGFVFDVTGPSPAAPPFGYTVLAFTGVALLSGALVSAAAGRYWVPFAAILLAAAVVSVLFEVPNAVHWHWAYAHFPGPVLPDGLPPAVFLSWPMQYVVFLAVPSLFVPRLAAVFWQPPG